MITVEDFVRSIEEMGFHYIGKTAAENTEWRLPTMSYQLRYPRDPNGYATLSIASNENGFKLRYRQRRPKPGLVCIVEDPNRPLDTDETTLELVGSIDSEHPDGDVKQIMRILQLFSNHRES